MEQLLGMDSNLIQSVQWNLGFDANLLHNQFLVVSALCKHNLASETKVRIFPFFLDWQGDGVEQNEAEAIELIKLSAEQVTLRNVCVYALLLVWHSSSKFLACYHA